MTKRLLTTLAVLLSAGLFCATPAAAQATRTWVSGVGDDVNPCSRTAPCRTYAGAISKTAAGGEINCIDPIPTGTVTITKSITIDCTAVFASSLSSGTNGVVINAPGGNVVLRGFSVQGAGTGLNGIRVLEANSVLIEGVRILGFATTTPNGNGITITPTNSNVSVTIIDTTISGNVTSGVSLAPQSAVSVNLSMYNTRIVNNGGIGVSVSTTTSGATVKVRVADSLISSGNTGGASGVVIKAPSGTVTGSISNSLIADNPAFGIRITAGTLIVSGTTITGNGTGVDVSGGTMTSSGNNTLNGNGVNGAFSGVTPTS